MTSEYAAIWKESGIEEIRSLRLPVVKFSNTETKYSSPSSLPAIQQWIGDCKRCALCEERNSIVFGTGNAESPLLFVGEGPGADEDAQGLPFVGRAGELLNKVIEAMGYQRQSVYIANVVKCRPPANRTPEPSEIEQCFPFLKAQIDVIRPKMIVALGLTAGRALLQTESSMGAIRGKFHPLPWNKEILVIPTYHPAYLLRNPSAKKEVWEDMKLVMQRMKQ